MSQYSGDGQSGACKVAVGVPNEDARREFIENPKCKTAVKKGDKDEEGEYGFVVELPRVPGMSVNLHEDIGNHGR